jgi:two-component system sensor histidine kinase PilS (NtrC family)
MTALRILTGPLESPLPKEDSFSFVIIIGVYLLTLVYAFLLRRGRAGRTSAYLQVLVDVVVASGLVYLTGGIESPFTFTYSLAVVAASILLYQRGALIAALSSSIAFTALALFIQHGLLRAPQGLLPLSTAKLVMALTSNLLALLLIGVLASYLSRQVRVAGGRLSAREEDLKKLAALQRQILASMPSGLVTCDGSGRVTYINRAASAILGLRADGPSPMEIDKLLPGASKLTPETRRNELPVETAEGPRILGLSVTSLEESGGALLVVFQDLTELRRMEEELKRVDRLASLGQLSAQLAHEIRNPLAAMRGSAQMLASESAGDGTASRLSGILVREADRLSHLVEEFLRFARPPPPRLENVSLGTLVAEVVEVLRGDPLSRGLQIEVSLAAVTARADAEQLSQVLINLVRNAFQAAAPGGKVRVATWADKETARIEVWDSAGSITPSDLNRIFEPFFTTRKGGTGLGLSTAHSIIRAHGGTIQVRSSPVSGTQFLIGLPAEP